MSKPGLIISLIFLLVAGSTGFIFYLSYGVRTDAPGNVRLEHLDSEVSIEWHEDGPVNIVADSYSDFYSALGYTHGMNRPWIVLLLRQAALGRLSEWFGRQAWNEDRLSKRLELAAMAEQAYESLSDQHKGYLIRYAEGMNAAFGSKRVRRKAPIVLLEIDPDPWEPWHAIAVERLWAWLSVSGLDANVEIPGVSDFVNADHALRSRLHMFGSGENTGLVVGGGAQLRHLFRYVTGDSGQPVFQVFTYTSSTETILDGVSVPGTFVFPAGRNHNGSWTYLMKGDAVIQRDSTSGLDPPAVSYDRILDYAGNEEVVTISRRAGAIVLEDGDRVDSTETRLIWSGLSGGSDAPNWLEIASTPLQAFSLIRSDGIVTENSTGSVISGAPSTSFRHTSGLLFATNSDAGQAQVERLQQIISGQSETQSDWELMHDTYSTYARKWNDRFLAALDSLGYRTVREDEAVEYLRNWDLSYRGSSIAASIAEITDREVRLTDSDTLTPAIVQEALNRAVLDLTGEFGPDMRKWRWETIQAISLYYPGWSSSESADDRRVRQFYSEFDPVSIPGGGHPTTLGWGPGIGLHWRKASSAWEGLFGVTPGDVFEYERPIVRYTSFLGRFLAENHAKVSLGVEAENDGKKKTRVTQSN